jgi:hypothetical protein
METVYIYCAAIGAALLIGQLLLSLLGFGHHELEAGQGVDFHAEGLHADLHSDLQDGHLDNGGHWYVGLLSFRAIVSALAVFGLVGLGLVREFNPPRPGATLVIALAAGGSMMYAVGWLLRVLYSLRADGTVRVERSVGLPGTVYLTVPAQKAGEGKVNVKIQDRIMELVAVTSGEEIPTGAAVVVVAVLSPHVIEVAPAAARSERPLAGNTHV